MLLTGRVWEEDLGRRWGIRTKKKKKLDQSFGGKSNRVSVPQNREKGRPWNDCFRGGPQQKKAGFKNLWKKKPTNSLGGPDRWFSFTDLTGFTGEGPPQGSKKERGGSLPCNEEKHINTSIDQTQLGVSHSRSKASGGSGLTGCP